VTSYKELDRVTSLKIVPPCVVSMLQPSSWDPDRWSCIDLAADQIDHSISLTLHYPFVRVVLDYVTLVELMSLGHLFLERKERLNTPYKYK